MNQQGTIVGNSISAAAVSTPVIWRAGQLTPIVLPGAQLLGLGNTNCVPTDVADVSSSAAPVAVGNCQAGNGTAAGVIWTPTGLAGAYVATALSAPSGSLSCVASAVNVMGQVLGTCDFGSGIGPHTVRWPAGGGAPIVLTTVAGNVRNVGVNMNAGGQITGTYLTAGDFAAPFYWNPDTNAVSTIDPISGGTNGVPVRIGDTGTVVGTAEVATGAVHAFEWTPAAGVTDLGVLAGGNNSAVSDLSKNGCFLTGSSEVSGEVAQLKPSHWDSDVSRAAFFDEARPRATVLGG
jgi:probable HAF family extracellular repeat protein